MNEFRTLLVREWREHRAAFVWGPAVVLALILIAGFAAVALGEDVEIHLSETERAELAERVGSSDVAGLEAMIAMTLDVAGSTDAELELKLDLLLAALLQPFHFVLAVLVFFALVAALYDERRDHSVLFWKSMPVGDTATVASKLAFAGWIAPVTTIVAVFLAQLFVVALVAFHVEDGMGGRIWSASGIAWRPFELALAYAVYGVWALPLYGWVLMVSAWASRVPILWALGVPIVAVVLEALLFGTRRLGDLFDSHLGTLVITDVHSGDGAWVPGPGDWLGMLLEPGVWLGVAAGVAFLAAAVWLRRRRNEI